MGTNVIAPIRELSRALDVGCGTGRWACEVCASFPDALVVGFDLEPSDPAKPPNFGSFRATSCRA